MEITADEKSWIQAKARQQYRKQIKIAKASGRACPQGVIFDWSEVDGSTNPTENPPTCPRCKKQFIILALERANVEHILSLIRNR